jgi:amidase
MWMDDPFCEIDQQMRAAFRQLKEVLVAQGVQVDEGSPNGKSLETYYPNYMNLLGSVMGASSKKMERRIMALVAPMANKLKDRVSLAKSFEQYIAGVSESHADWLSASEKRFRLRERFIQTFNKYDVILTPVAMTTAFKHQQKPEVPLRRIKVNGKKRIYVDMFKWIAPATLLGLPATSAPIGAAGSMPVNVQILGAPYQDKTTIHFAGLLAEKMGGFMPPPDFKPAD